MQDVAIRVQYFAYIKNRTECQYNLHQRDH